MTLFLHIPRKMHLEVELTEQIIPLTVREGREERVFDTDEFPQNSSVEKLSQLRPAFKEDGMVTPGMLAGSTMVRLRLW